MYEVMFFIISWKFIQYTIHWDKTQILKKIALDKMLQKMHSFSSVSSNSSFLLLICYSFKVNLSKSVCDIFQLWFCFVFIKIYIFVQHKPWTLWLQIVIIPFKIRIVENPLTLLLPDLWLLSCKKKFWNSMISAWVRVLQKLTWTIIFWTLKIKFFRTSVFLNGNFWVNIWHSFTC